LGAVRDAAGRFAALARQVTDPSAPVRDSTWTTGDLVAHVTGGLEAYVRYLNGDDEAVVDVSDVAGGSLVASNRQRLAEESVRSIPALLNRASIALERLPAAIAGRSADDIVPWHGRREPLRSLLATALAEQLLHGRDLARTIGAPWTISKQDAALVVHNVAPLLPVLVDQRTASSLEASIRIKVRGGDTIRLAFDRGTLTVNGAHDRERCDATISADPLAFLLVAYGRCGQWSQIARGRLLAWGRKPWLALRLTKYLVHP
jgi:uncharacterized protein (TIGR03083 family)